MERHGGNLVKARGHARVSKGISPSGEANLGLVRRASSNDVSGWGRFRRTGTHRPEAQTGDNCYHRPDHSKEEDEWTSSAAARRRQIKVRQVGSQGRFESTR